MKILITIKSVINYLYNNLIDLIWTKKIRFADGTEMTTASSSSSATIDYFEGITGTTLNTYLPLDNFVLVFKNGVLLQPTEDYSISSSIITFVVALETTDKIGVLQI